MIPDADHIVRWLGENGVAADARDGLSEATALLDGGLIDSMQIMVLVSHLEEQSGMTIPLDEVVPENFETPRAIAAMMARLAGGRETA